MCVERKGLMRVSCTDTGRQDTEAQTWGKGSISKALASRDFTRWVLARNVFGVCKSFHRNQPTDVLHSNPGRVITLFLIFLCIPPPAVRTTVNSFLYFPVLKMYRLVNELHIHVCVYTFLNTWVGACGLCPFGLWYPSCLFFSVIADSYLSHIWMFYMHYLI